MFRLMLALVAATSMCGAALAADLAAKPPPAAPALPASWTGFYVGVHAGAASGEERVFDHTISVLAAETATVTRGNWLAGVQAGYNTTLLGHWIIGTEIDLSATDLGATTLTNENAFRARASFHELGTVRTRLGYAFARTLLYATAGTAWAHDTFRYTPGGLVQMDAHQFHLGWAAGFGADHALDAHWSARAEYLHADFGRDDAIYVNEARTTRLSADLVRLGLNYRLGTTATATVAALPVKAPRALTADRWSGDYFGGHLAYSRGLFDLDDALTPNAVRLAPNGLLGGIQGGYNYRLGDAVVGVEADQSFGALRASAFTPGNLLMPVFDESTRVRLDGFGSARARFGVAADRVFAYLTGGLGWTRASFAESSVNGTDAARKEYRLGPTAGAGIELALSQHWSAKLEYLHSDFGTSRDVVFDAALPVNYTLKTDVVRVGMNYYGDIFAALGLR